MRMDFILRQRRQEGNMARMNSLSMEGKVALITGAKRGIGRGCALELARRGARVMINDLAPAPEADSVLHEVGELGSQALVVQGDVAVRADCERMVEETVRQFGRIDILIANAAYSVRKPFLELEADDWQRTLDVILSGAFHVSQFACPRMAAQGGGGRVIGS